VLQILQFTTKARRVGHDWLLWRMVTPRSVPSIPAPTGKGNLLPKLYLRDLSERDKLWDKHRKNTDKIADIYSNADHSNYAERLSGCSGLLLFGSTPADESGVQKIKLRSASFCRVRHCPVCFWRRSLTWKARFGKVLPIIEKDYPKIRWLHLTLAIRNCAISDLRETIQLMNAAWQRLTQTKKFPAIGYFKALEVTRGEDGSAHPHFHILLMVEPKYFGGNYINQKEWVAMWKKVLRVDYDPTAHVQAIKVLGENGTISDAVKEVVKYTVKPEDLIAEDKWLIELTKQLHKTRAISLGGVLKQYLSEDDASNQELLLGDDSITSLDQLVDPHFMANWDKSDSRYVIKD
jgi:plasmid rolling circle replication initiator protein Rep